MSPEQELLLKSVESRLETRGARSERRTHGDALEPWIELRLALPSERGLDVRLVVAPDVFAIQVNGAQLRLERVDFGDDADEWRDECVRTLEALMDADLRIRVRRTFTGSPVGAVRVPRGGRRDVWNGDLLACLGFGKERTFADWWTPPG